MDEAWRFFSHPAIRYYSIETLKTWRRKNAAMILSTRSLDRLRKSEILDAVIESWRDQKFLSNPDLDQELYRII